MCRYCSTPADLASLHTLCRTTQHRLEALKATVLASSACGLGVSGMCQVNCQNMVELLSLNHFKNMAQRCATGCLTTLDTWKIWLSARPFINMNWTPEYFLSA